MTANSVDYDDLYNKVVEKNDAEAFNTIKEAAEAGNAEALYSLGNCYYLGNYVAKDREQSVKYYLKAAELDNGPAQFALAALYYMGEGVEKSNVKYEKWMRKAEEKGLHAKGKRPRFYLPPDMK